MPQKKAIISVKNLQRCFGEVKAVKDISFDIYPGQVVGFIGANGAGKTTTMRMLATLERPDSGSISINGTDAIDDPASIRPQIAWVPDEFGRYDNLTIAEYLDFFARSFNYQGQERRNRVQEVLDFTGLSQLADRFTDKLSKGQGQRLCVARALLHDPEILLMDEPAAGLDPKARIELKNLILILAKEGKTLFISSHILSELSEMCDTMLFIDQGRVLHHGAAEELKHDKQEKLCILVRLADNPEALEQWVELNPGVEIAELNNKGARLLFEQRDEAFVADTLKRMILDGLTVCEFHKIEKKLEDSFVDLLDQQQEQEENK